MARRASAFRSTQPQQPSAAQLGGCCTLLHRFVAHGHTVRGLMPERTPRRPLAPQSQSDTFSHTDTSLKTMQSVQDVELQLSGPQSDALVKSIGIPPRPAVLLELQKEIAKEDPDLRSVARLVAGDVALTAALLRTVNSPAFGL